MCAEAPVFVFQLVAVGVESQDKQSKEKERAEVQPALIAKN